MSPRKTRSVVPELKDDAPVHQNRNKTKIVTAQDAKVVSQSTRALHNRRSSKPTASKSSGKDKASNNMKSSAPGSAKASAATTKKQKQAEEKQRQQGKYTLIVTNFTAI